MNKQVLLDQQEYEHIINILAEIVEKLDSYVDKENKRPNLDCHITDSPKCDKYFKHLYSMFLHIDGDLKSDIINKLSVKYFDKFPNSVLADDMDF